MTDYSTVIETPPIPDTPAGQQLAAYVAAFNSGDNRVVAGFITEHFAASALTQRPVEQRASNEAALYHFTHGFEVRHIEQSVEHNIVALLQARLDQAWMRVSLLVDAEPPHGITAIPLSPVPRPADAGPHGRMSETAIVRELVLHIEKLVEADVFSGAVLLAKDGIPIFTTAHGLASIGYNIPNRIDTKFNLGSMNKMFTGVAIVQLAAQGKLSFDDHVSSYLPAYPRPVAEKITIHQLLTHTSGLASYWNERFEAAKTRVRTVDDFLALFLDEPLSFEPGERFQYSNAGYVVLGAVIEAVSGRDYYDYVREHVYGSAAMLHTDSYELDWDVPNLAFGYTHQSPNQRFAPGPRRNNLFLHGLRGSPAGGGYSTVEDLLRFANALQAHQLLTPEYTGIALGGRVAAGPTMQRAYGFVDQRITGTRIVGHSGGFPGINSYLDIYFDHGYTAAVLTNYDPPAAELIVNKLRDMITQE